jgi:hypothetical protein
MVGMIHEGSRLPEIPAILQAFIGIQIFCGAAIIGYLLLPGHASE